MTGTPFDVLNNLSKQIEAQMEKTGKDTGAVNYDTRNH